MALSRSIIRGILSCSLVAVLLSGCAEYNVTDYLRPDLNLNSAVRVYLPGTGEDDGDSEGEGKPNEGNNSSVQLGNPVPVASSVWSGGSPNNSFFTYKNPNRDVDTSAFERTTAAIVEATDYGQYLREQVYDEILKVLNTLPEETRGKVYVRCGHTGYDYDSKAMHKVPGWSDSTVGRNVSLDRVVGGASLITLATDWLGGLDVNKQHQESQVSSAQATINSYIKDGDMEKNWYQLAGSSLPSIYYKMFGREGANFSTLKDYYGSLATDPYHNIPNYNLYYYTGENTTNKMTFNKVNGNSVDRFVAGVPLETVDKLFSTYSQYPSRSRETVSNTVTDSDSILKYYLDGYNKTAIFVGTTAGENLKETLGTEAYTKIFDLVSKAYLCKDVASVTSIKKTTQDDEGKTVTLADYSQFTVIPAGSKGVD